ncbi:MAG TPA: glycosyltransferase [Acidimicrobiales bacterium]|nr:glycosyltransferase [Acidimicrobiales bacterium]
MTAPGAGGRRLRVLWLIKGLDVGGAERLLVSCAAVADFDRFEYEAAYVIPSRSALVPPLEEAGIVVHCLGRDSHLDLRWAWHLRVLLLRRRYDIVHMHLPYTTLIGSCVVGSLPRRRRPAVVITQHSMWSALSVVTRIPNRFVMRRARARVAVSRMTAASLPRPLRNRAEVIVHGVEVNDETLTEADRAAVRADLGVADGEVLITAVANFRADKGHDVLLAAARRLVDAGVPVRFAVIGHGELEGQVRDLRAELGLEAEVMLLGLRMDAVRIVSASDVFVLASLHEGFPVSLMEALASGVPVVASAVGGVPEAVTDGVEGLVVPPGQPQALAEALERISLDPEGRRAMAEAARRRGGNFDIRRAMDRIEEIYSTMAVPPR